MNGFAAAVAPPWFRSPRHNPPYSDAGLARRPPAGAPRHSGQGNLDRYQTEALRLASAGGGVRREDVMARCGISRESARRTLASLVELGDLRRLGSGRGAWYVLRTPEETGG